MCEFGLSNVSMNKEKFVEIIRGILKTDANLDFLLQLRENELETLVAIIRDRVEQ
jgi:hypothetical protein